MINFPIEKIVAPVQTINAIEQFIIKNNLVEFHDEIYFFIAKIQDIYESEYEFYEAKRSQKQVKEFKDQVQKLIQAIDLFKNKHKYEDVKKNYFPELKQIIFDFGDKQFSITDPVLHLTLINPFIYQDRGETWEELLTNFPKRIYGPNHFKNQFKYNCAKAICNFLINETTFRQSIDKAIPNTTILAVADILEFSLIKIYDKNKEEIMSEYYKTRTVRNWIQVY
jgi:hypothetical protein